jgi:hypothetical protein
VDVTPLPRLLVRPEASPAKDQYFAKGAENVSEEVRFRGVNANWCLSCILDLRVRADVQHLALNDAPVALRRSGDVVVRLHNSVNTSRPVYDLESLILVPGDGVENVGEGSRDFACVLKFLDNILYPCKAEFVDVEVRRVAKQVAQALR